MKVFYVPEDTLRRLKTFLNSPESEGLPEYSFTERWRNDHERVNLDIDHSKVVLARKGEYYYPAADTTEKRKLSPASNVIQEILSVVQNSRRYLSTLRSRIKGKLGRTLINWLRLDYRAAYMDFGIAFDAVMNHRPEAEVRISPHRINFLDLRKYQAVIPSTEAIKRNYSEIVGLEFTSPVNYAYYDYNILVGLTKIDGVETILEIGPGNGNLASLFHASFKKRFIMIDLPKPLCQLAALLSSLFPEAKIVLPQEASMAWPRYADFVFLTPGQIHLIPDNSVELAINTKSFEGMTHMQIVEYFALIQRACKNDGYFYTRNRAENLPDELIPQSTIEPLTRFWEYPWNQNNRILAYEPCQLSRLTQRDPVYLRLEQIGK